MNKQESEQTYINLSLPFGKDDDVYSIMRQLTIVSNVIHKGILQEESKEYSKSIDDFLYQKRYYQDEIWTSSIQITTDDFTHFVMDFAIGNQVLIHITVYDKYMIMFTKDRECNRKFVELLVEEISNSNLEFKIGEQK